MDVMQHDAGTAANRFDMFGWLRAKTLRNGAILRVVGTAFLEGVSLPEAVELTRKQIRGEIRGYRTRARECWNRPQYREHWTKCAERACRESQRVRRLQREFASWQKA